MARDRERTTADTASSPANPEPHERQRHFWNDIKEETTAVGAFEGVRLIIQALLRKTAEKGIGKAADHLSDKAIEAFTKAPPRDLFSRVLFIVLKPEETEKLRKRLAKAAKDCTEAEMITLICKVLACETEEDRQKWSELLAKAEKLDDNQVRDFVKKMYGEERQNRWAQTLRTINNMDEPVFKQFIYSLKDDGLQQRAKRFYNMLTRETRTTIRKESKKLAPMLRGLNEWLEARQRERKIRKGESV